MPKPKADPAQLIAEYFSLLDEITSVREAWIRRGGVRRERKLKDLRKRADKLAAIAKRSRIKLERPEGSIPFRPIWNSDNFG